MKTKLIMVEGIPGSGKSTFAQKIAEYYKDKNVLVNLINEGQAHPADLAWSAHVPLSLLEDLLFRYSKFDNEIRKNMHIENDHVIISYTQVKNADENFYKELESYEIYNNRVPFDIFCDLLYSRWKRFGKHAEQKDELSIFECAYLQNNVNELLNYQLASGKEIESHLKKLLSYVMNLSPVLIYLSQTNIRETVERIAKERISRYGNWIDMAVEYIENTPYGKQNNLKGFDGLIHCIEERKRIELDIIKKLPIKSIIVQNENYQWEEVWKDIEFFLEGN